MTEALLRSQVTIKTQNHGQEKHVWFFFESEHEDLWELNETLVEDGTVYGQRVETEAMPGGRRRVTRRFDCILSRDAIVTITEPQYQVVEEAELTQ